jgi:hypothetical protein
MSGFISSSPFQNTKWFLQIQSLAPGIARRSSEWFQLRCQLRRAITPNPCIIWWIQGYHCVRLVKGFVGARSVRWADPPNLRQSTDFSSAPARVFFPDEKPPLLYLGFLRVLHFPVRAGLPSLSPHHPRRRRPFPLRGGGGGQRPATTAVIPRPSPATVATPRAPAPTPSRPDPTSPAQPPFLSSPLSSMDGRKKMKRGRRRWQFYKFSPRELQYGLEQS